MRRTITLSMVVLWSLVTSSRADAAVVNHCGTLSADETWGSGDTHVLTCTVFVSTGVKLTIQPGAVVAAYTNGVYALQVASGELDARGTSANPIVFTTTDDAATPNLSPVAGDWSGVILTNATITNDQLAHLDIRGAAIGLRLNNIGDPMGTAVQVSSLVVSATTGDGVVANGGNIELDQFSGSTIGDDCVTAITSAKLRVSNASCDVAGNDCYVAIGSSNLTIDTATCTNATRHGAVGNTATLDITRLSVDTVGNDAVQCGSGTLTLANSVLENANSGITANTCELTVRQTRIRGMSIRGITIVGSGSNTSTIEHTLITEPALATTDGIFHNSSSGTLHMRFNTLDGRGSADSGIIATTGSGTLVGNNVVGFTVTNIAFSASYTLQANNSFGGGCSFSQGSCLGSAPAGNTILNPMFRNPPGDYRLSSGSPAALFDAVDPASLTTTPAEDVEAHARIGFFDVGAYEVPVVTSVVPSSGDRGTTVNIALTGYNFSPTITTVELLLASGVDTDISLQGGLSATGTAASGDFAIASGAALGLRDVRVTNTGGPQATDTATEAFEVTDVPPDDAGVPDAMPADAMTVDAMPADAGGVTDATLVADADMGAVDAPIIQVDAGENGGDEGGCGCRGGTPDHGASALPLVVVTVIGLRRRNRTILADSK